MMIQAQYISLTQTMDKGPSQSPSIPWGTTIKINRVELSGIHQALKSERSQSTRNLDIYTDSGCSLSLFLRTLNSPWTLRDSKHLNLNDILTELREENSHTSIKSGHILESTGTRGRTMERP